MLVRAAMLPDPLVVTPETGMLEFIHKVIASTQTTAAVVENEKLVGMVSVQDVFRLILPNYVGRDMRLADVLHESYFEERFVEIEKLSVRDLMDEPVLDTVGPDDSVLHCVALFVHKGRKTLPVVEGDRYVGSVTRRSILRKVTEAAGPRFSGA